MLKSDSFLKFLVKKILGWFYKRFTWRWQKLLKQIEHAWLHGFRRGGSNDYSVEVAGCDGCDCSKLNLTVIRNIRLYWKYLFPLQSLLLPKDLQRYLGTRTLKSTARELFSGTVLLGSWKNPERIHAWLTCLLLILVSAGRQNNDKVITSSRSSVSSSSLETRVTPSHWISDFMQNTLLIDYLAYNKELPRPVTELTRRVCARCCAIWHLAVQRSAVTALLFYNNAFELHPRSLDSFSSTLPTVVDGNVHPPRGTIHVCTCQDLSIWVIKKSVD